MVGYSNPNLNSAANNFLLYARLISTKMTAAIVFTSGLDRRMQLVHNMYPQLTIQFRLRLQPPPQHLILPWNTKTQTEAIIAAFSPHQ